MAVNNKELPCRYWYMFDKCSKKNSSCKFRHDIKAEDIRYLRVTNSERWTSVRNKISDRTDCQIEFEYNSRTYIRFDDHKKLKQFFKDNKDLKLDPTYYDNFHYYERLKQSGDCTREFLEAADGSGTIRLADDVTVTVSEPIDFKETYTDLRKNPECKEYLGMSLAKAQKKAKVSVQEVMVRFGLETENSDFLKYVESLVSQLEKEKERNVSQKSVYKGSQKSLIMSRSVLKSLCVAEGINGKKSCAFYFFMHNGSVHYVGTPSEPTIPLNSYIMECHVKDREKNMLENEQDFKPLEGVSIQGNAVTFLCSPDVQKGNGTLVELKSINLLSGTDYKSAKELLRSTINVHGLDCDFVKADLKIGFLVKIDNTTKMIICEVGYDAVISILDADATSRDENLQERLDDFCSELQNLQNSTSLCHAEFTYASKEWVLSEVNQEKCDERYVKDYDYMKGQLELD